MSIGIYELNNVALLREAYIDAYLASAQNYKALRADVETRCSFRAHFRWTAHAIGLSVKPLVQFSHRQYNGMPYPHCRSVLCGPSQAQQKGLSACFLVE